MFLQKIKKVAASDDTPVVPATQEAKMGGLLEDKRSRLQRAMIAPLLSSLGDRARPYPQNLKKLKIRAGHGGSHP